MRTIGLIATEIARDWREPNFAAVPYLRAMRVLGTIDDRYGEDSARSVVAYFLCNARSWRGEVAKRIKAELNAMLKG